MGGVGHLDTTIRHRLAFTLRGSAPSFVAGMEELCFDTGRERGQLLRQAVAAIGGQRITLATAVPQ
jgi:hypothetical protein